MLLKAGVRGPAAEPGCGHEQAAVGRGRSFGSICAPRDWARRAGNDSPEVRTELGVFFVRELGDEQALLIGRNQRAETLNAPRELGVLVRRSSTGRDGSSTISARLCWASGLGTSSQGRRGGQTGPGWCQGDDQSAAPPRSGRRRRGSWVDEAIRARSEALRSHNRYVRPDSAWRA